ncbi:MAG: site-2 protease family protein, partial [Acholeplasmatales bacterium]|nr:site-2 protease family protein [Acholeplasmatales bacterium]
MINIIKILDVLSTLKQVGSVTWSILVFLLVLVLIIGIHELGHFFLAKRASVLCFEYGIGMGPALYKKRKGETLYTIRAIPIGGAVMMSGEEAIIDYFKVGDTIALHLNSFSKVDKIILNGSEKYTTKGVVSSFDLFGKAYTSKKDSLKEEYENALKEIDLLGIDDDSVKEKKELLKNKYLENENLLKVEFQNKFNDSFLALKEEKKQLKNAKRSLFLERIT